MDIQILLVFILALLTLSLMAVGFYVITVLKELRETIKKSNNILDNVQEVTESVTNPISTISSIISGITQGFKAVKTITTLRGDGNEEKEDIKNVQQKRK